MADTDAVTAWRSFAEERAGSNPAPVPELDPSQAAADRRAADRAAILSKGDTWARQAVEYEREMTAAPRKPDPAA